MSVQLCGKWTVSTNFILNAINYMRKDELDYATKCRGGGRILQAMKGHHFFFSEKYLFYLRRSREI